MITDQEIVEAGRVLLQARKERGASDVAPSPSVAAALDQIALPTDDAIARGPVSILTDAEVDANLAKLGAAVAGKTAGVGLARRVLGFFGL